MGIEKDYLMRQLMMLFEVIQKIFMHRKKGEIEQAERQISFFYKSMKIETDLQQLSVLQLEDLLENQMKLCGEQIEQLAFVLKEQGELETQTESRLDFFRKSYFLLEKVEQEGAWFSMERAMKLEELRNYLDDK